MSCTECVRLYNADAALRGYIASTDTSSPWAVACRNCEKVRADVFCYLVKDDTAASIGVAINKVRTGGGCREQGGSAVPHYKCQDQQQQARLAIFRVGASRR